MLEKVLWERLVWHDQELCEVVEEGVRGAHRFRWLRRGLLLLRFDWLILFFFRLFLSFLNDYVIVFICGSWIRVCKGCRSRLQISFLASYLHLFFFRTHLDFYHGFGSLWGLDSCDFFFFFLHFPLTSNRFATFSISLSLCNCLLGPFASVGAIDQFFFVRRLFHWRFKLIFFFRLFRHLLFPLFALLYLYLVFLFLLKVFLVGNFDEFAFSVSRLVIRESALLVGSLHSAYDCAPSWLRWLDWWGFLHLRSFVHSLHFRSRGFRSQRLTRLLSRRLGLWNCRFRTRWRSWWLSWWRRCWSWWSAHFASLLHPESLLLTCQPLRHLLPELRVVVRPGDRRDAVDLLFLVKLCDVFDELVD